MNTREKLKSLLSISAYAGKTVDDVVVLLNTASGTTTPAQKILGRAAVVADVNAANMLLAEFLATDTFAGLDNDSIVDALNTVNGSASLADICLGRGATIDDVVSVKGV